MTKLSLKQKLFVEYYSSSGDGKKAALKAGYSAKYPSRSAHQLLKNPAIKQAVESQQQEAFKALNIEREDKIRVLWYIAKTHYKKSDARAAISAITELNKMQGDYAPVKQDVKQTIQFTEIDEELLGDSECAY